MRPIEMLDTHWQEEYCSGDCNFGIPCQACGSNGQYIGKVTVLKTCGQCADFGPIGCTTSKHEQKFGNASTPSCDEFKRKVMQTQKNSLEDVANEIQDQMLEIRRNGNHPAYVILDRNTWIMLRGSKDAEEYVWFGHKQRDYESPDKICGLPIALLTGHKDEQTIKVVE